MVVKVIVGTILSGVFLLMLGLGSSIGYNIFLSMTRYTPDSDQEYGIYAFWIWTLMATILVLILATLLRYLLVKKFDAAPMYGNTMFFVFSIISIGAIVATATGVGVGVVKFMQGSF